MSDINTATLQMHALGADAGIRRIAYIVINLDDNLHEYAVEYRRQIDAFIERAAMPNVEVVLDIKAPFYSAM